jgi:hypothetical protein
VNTPQTPSFGLTGRFLRFIGRLIAGVIKLTLTAILIAVLLVTAAGGAWALGPVKIADGEAPRWQVARAYATELSHLSPKCRTLYIVLIPQAAQTVLLPLMAASGGQLIWPEALPLTATYFQEAADMLFFDPKMTCHLTAPDRLTQHDLAGGN